MPKMPKSSGLRPRSGELRSPAPKEPRSSGSLNEIPISSRLDSGLSLNTKLCAIASFFVDISSEMVFPILPFFITQILGAPVFAVALIDGAGEFFANLANMLFGFYSDKKGKKKPFVIWGYSLSGLMKGFLIFVTGWWQVFFIRVIERFGKGLRGAPRDSLIALSEDEKHLGQAIGFRKMMDNAGAVLGPLLCGILLALFLDGNAADTYKLIFLIGFALAIIGVVASLFLQEKSTKPQKTGAILNDMLNSAEYKYFLASSAVFAIGQFSIMMFILKAGDYLSILFIPIVYLAYNLFYTVFAMPAGRLADKVGAKKTLLLGWFVFLLAMFGFLFVSNSITMLPLFALLGLFMALNETAPRILVAKLVTKEHYASALGTYNGVTGMLTLGANMIAGFLWSASLLSLHTPFIFSAVMTILAMGLMLFFIRNTDPNHKSQPK